MVICQLYLHYFLSLTIATPDNSHVFISFMLKGTLDFSPICFVLESDKLILLHFLNNLFYYGVYVEFHKSVEVLHQNLT